jgi:CHC2-type zinc finger protein
MRLSEDIKAALSIVDEFRRDGHELKKIGSRFVCLCPFHQERTPSCHVTPDTGRFHCFGCGSDGTVIDFHALKRGITPAEAITELAARLRIPLESNSTNGHTEPAKPREPEPPKKRRRLKLPELQKGNATEFAQLSDCRRVSVDALKLASDRGLLWFCDMADGTNTVRAWIIADRTRRNAQARRLDGKRWQHAWDAESKQWLPVEPDRQRKVRGFTGNQASWPVGIEEARRFDNIAILEGVDLLAAFHFLISEGRENAVGPVAILGASNRIPADALKLFAGKRVRMFPHADENLAGLCAAANWGAQLLPIVTRVDAFDFTGLVQCGGKPVKDLNDLTNIDYDCMEAERDVMSIMNF